MIIIERKPDETIDRVLKRYKRKHRNIKLRNELQKRRFFTKKSVKRRHEILDAEYRHKKFSTN